LIGVAADRTEVLELVVCGHVDHDKLIEQPPGLNTETWPTIGV
jgi:hypothetical protein